MLSQKTTTKHQGESRPEPQLEPEPYHPRTRAKNATQHPGAEAEKRLRVCRDPEVIREEQEARQRRKDEKERARQEEAANNEAATRFVEESHAQQKVATAEEEASMPRRRSQGK